MTLDWYNCYRDSWDRLITPESFAHPAKAARGLLVRIFAYAFERGWLWKGATVVDCFSGIGTTLIEGASRGCYVVGCELEPCFVDLVKANIELHRAMWEASGDPIPVIVQGDSRRLVELLGLALADAVCSSPPFGQLSAMPGGIADSIISSPPYAQAISGDHGETETAAESLAKRRTKGGSLGQSCRFGSYGITPGNISNLNSDTFWAAAKIIISQCFLILRPSGMAIWITKDFIRNKVRVPFSNDWKRLNEVCGFEFVEWIKASLVETDEHPSLFDQVDTTKRTKRASFFRRLYEKKYPDNAIDEEDVLVFRKPYAITIL